jgi:hypothetical protein
MKKQAKKTATKTFEVIRADINKKVVPAMKYIDEAAAVGEYVSCLMLAGIIKMSRNGGEYTENGNGEYTLSNGWQIKVVAV